MNKRMKRGQCGVEQQEENTLSNLKKGQSGRVECMNLNSGMARRLQDIGLTEGTTVECVQKSPGGDPTAYLIRGAVMALRKEDAAKVKIGVMREERKR